MIHVQWSFCEIAHALNKFWLVGSWFLDTRSSGSIAQWNNFRPIKTLGDILYPGFWLVENCFTMWCICCHWTLFPKINFQPIRTCLTHAQFRRMTVGHVSFHWTCIALHSVYHIHLKMNVPILEWSTKNIFHPLTPTDPCIPAMHILIWCNKLLSSAMPHLLNDLFLVQWLSSYSLS